MPHNQIKHIIFDFGGVILKHRPDLMEHIISQIFTTHIDRSKELWLKHRIKILKGNITSNQFLQLMQQETDKDISSEKLNKLWKKLYTDLARDVNWELLEFIKLLRKRYRVYLLTDTIDIHDEHNRKRHIYDLFHRAFKSHEENLAKAESDAAFLNVLRKIKAKPEECVFIDDFPEYTNRARKLRMMGIIYKDLNQLKHKLKILGITA